MVETEVLARREGGDRGDVLPENAREDARSLEYGRLHVISYPIGDAGGKVRIIEADRSSTCIFLPEDYRSCT